MTGGWKRASWRLLIVGAARFLVSFVLLNIALVFWAGRGSMIAPVLIVAAGVVFALLRVVWIVIRWVVERYRLDPDGLVMRTGVFRRQERHLAWATVAAVDEQAGLGFRALGIRRLHLIQSDAAGGAVAFRALEPAAADAVRRFVRAMASGASSAGDSPGGGEIYRTSWRELALMSLVNGRFALLAPPVLFACWGMLGDVGVSTWLFEVLGMLRPAVLVVGAILGFVVIGALATISRYQGFSARLTGTGMLVLSYGFVEKRERRIDLASIEGITVGRSLVEQILRRSRLAVLTFTGTDEVGASTVLPSLPDAVVRQIARSHFRAFVQGSALLADRPAPILRQLFRTVLVFAAPLSAAIIMLDRGVPLAIAAVTAAAVLGIATLIGRVLVARISIDPHDIVKIERHLVSETETYVSARACHSVWSVHPVGMARPLFFSTHFYAGGPRSFVGALCSPESLRRLREVMAGVDEPAVRRWRTAAGPKSFASISVPQELKP